MPPRRRPKRGKQKTAGRAKQSNDNNNVGALSHLKPLLKAGDEVFSERHGYGTVVSELGNADSSTSRSGPYGPKRTYSVKLRDHHGHENDVQAVEDHRVRLKSEHVLIEKKKGKLIGVKNEVDRNCGDAWARTVGWWVATTIDGKVHPFSLLADAVQAYDSSVVEKWENRKDQGEKIKESDLNLPEKWPHLFDKRGGKSSTYKAVKGDDMKYNVLVQFPDGEFAEIETFRSQTIDAFKQSIENSLGRASVTSKMMFEGKELENDRHIAEYDIERDSILAMQMQIYVGFLSKKGFLLDVDPYVTIAEVKAMVESKEQDFSSFRQRLFLEGNNLEDGMTLLQCNISDGDNLFVLVRDENDKPPKDGCMQIYVKCDDKIHTLDALPNDTISVVKSVLWEKVRVLPDCQRLSFGGSYLENPSDTLSECGITSECMLYLVVSQEPKSGSIQAHHVDNDIDLQRTRQSTLRNDDTQDEEKITIFLMNPAVQTDGIPYVMKKDTPLSQIFSDYASRVNMQTSNLQFICGEYGELPSNCEFSAEALALSDGDTILVNSTAPSYMQPMPNEAERNSVLDLTAFSTGSNSDDDFITVILEGFGEETRVKVDRNITSLQLLFDSFADRKNVDPASLTYICDARRFSHEADETAAQGGINNGDVIHVIEKPKYLSKPNSIPGDGKIVLNLLEIGYPESEKEFFRVDVNFRLERIFKSFANRKKMKLSQIRFLYQGRILYADSEDDTTPAQLGIREGAIVSVLTKKAKPVMQLTPHAIKTLYQMPRDRIFEPVLQVIKLDRANMELTISDGNSFFAISYHVRLNCLIESGAISKFAIIWASDISVDTFGFYQHKKFSILDADVAAPNPNKTIGSPTLLVAPSTSHPTDNTPSVAVTTEIVTSEKTSKKTPSGRYVTDWTVYQHIYKMPRGEGEHHVRRKWLSRTSFEENCYNDHALGGKFYCPQVGDSLVYIPRAHYDTLRKFPVADYSYPWKSWPTDFSWSVVRCEVTHIRYRFPYEKCYKSRYSDGKLRGVAAIVSLKITGVPSQSSTQLFSWPTLPFGSPSSEHSFEVTVFECHKETFIIPEFLYSWRINGLDKAIEFNNYGVDGLRIFGHETEYYEDGAEDEEYGGFRASMENILATNEDELHFKDSGYRTIDCNFSVYSAWNVAVEGAPVPAPIVPKISANAAETFERWIPKMLRLDPSVQDFLDPVDTSEYVDYLDMIEVPMCLSLIQKRLNCNYYTNKRSVLADMELVKENCYKYHGNDNHLYTTATLMYENFKSMVDSFVEEGQVLLKFASADGEILSFHYNLSFDLKPLLLRYSVESGVLLKCLRFNFDQTVIHTNSRRKQIPSELGMKSGGTYSIRVLKLSAEEQRFQELYEQKIQLDKVRRIIARNVIASFIWRCHEQGQQRKARKAITDLVWRRIALRRRQQLRIGVIMIQKLHRGLSTRKIYGGQVQMRLEEFRQFSSVWKQTIEQVPRSVHTLTGWALVRERIDVKKVEFMDEDGNLADTDEKLNKALTGALNEEVAEAGESEEGEIESKIDDLTIEENSAGAENDQAELDWSQFQVTAHVVKFMKTGDAKYREIFVKKMKQLAKGERSHKLQKPLKGCESTIYESYLENKGGGFRILWTQEDNRIVVWFIAKHKWVSRLAKLIDDAKNRTARQQMSDSFVSEMESGNYTCSDSPSQGKKEILLDALGNVPLKLYDVNFDNVDDIAKKSWTPQMHLTDEEREVVEAKGTVLLLGRSGTGKTICICNRIEYDRQRLGHKPNFSQLFVSRSSQLCRYVKDAVGNVEGISFTTFDTLVRHLIESPLSEVINGNFRPRQYVNFARFNQDFYTERYPQENVSALIVWKSIRTFLKGSIEAFQTSTGLLSKEYFIHPKKLGKNRCKISLEMRDIVYDIFLQYQLWMDEGHLWDDCDRILAVLKGMQDAKKSHSSAYDEQIKKSKLYVDEVQDYTQLEILMFFYIGGGPGALFLAGDPAQSVVEGTDFRFEEVRSVGYFVAGSERRHLIPEKPKTVNVNFRSHAGVLNCAGGFLDLLFGYFPGGAKQLKKDFGLFKGARPGVFHHVQVQHLSTLLKEKMPGAVVLTHDESASRWKKMLGHKLVYGIREAKGLEFKSVVILDFFAEIPSSLQKPWRNLLLNREGSDFKSRYPLVETHLKLVYTAVTRCIEQLFFAETSSSAAGDAAVRWLTTNIHTKDQANCEALATINNVRELESMTMTNDEFCVVGIDNAELAGSSDIELHQARSYLDRAIYCFHAAQNTELVAKAQAQVQSVQLREKLIRMDSPIAKDIMEMTEREVTQVLKSLLRENLLMECMNLLSLIAPILSSYTQQKLDECITSRIQHVLSE